MSLMLLLVGPPDFGEADLLERAEHFYRLWFLRLMNLAATRNLGGGSQDLSLAPPPPIHALKQTGSP